MGIAEHYRERETDSEWQRERHVGRQREKESGGSARRNRVAFDLHTGAHKKKMQTNNGMIAVFQVPLCEYRSCLVDRTRI